MAAIAQAIESIDIAQARDLGRQREQLQLNLKHKTEDLAAHQRHIATLTGNFQNPTEATERLFVESQHVLRERRQALEDARRAVAAFNESYPTQEELVRREKFLLINAELAEQKKVRDEFVENTRLRLECLIKLEQLERAAEKIVITAKTRWPTHTPSPVGSRPVSYSNGVLAAAGIDDTLVPMLQEPDLWEWAGKKELGRWNSEIRKKVEKSLKWYETN